MRTINLFTALAVSLGCAGPIACSQADKSEVSAQGTVRLPLVATASSGSLYRLTGATFTLKDSASVTAATLSSETNPSAATIASTVPVGSYTMSLASGWTMVKVINGTETPVTAQLVSAAAQPVTVSVNSVSLVTYQFSVDGTVVQTGVGEVDVAISVTETKASGGSTSVGGSSSTGGTANIGGSGGAGGAGAGGSVQCTTPATTGWVSNVNYGGPLQMDLYTPTKVAPSPGVLVAIHYCSGTSTNAHGWFDSYANKYGFYIIAPNAGKTCFDASASRSGDRDAIVKMVQYAIAQKGVNSAKVFTAGPSSGGCMTNTLLAIYPDVFAAGSALPGLPAGAWPAGDTTCTKCGTTPPTMTAQQWGDLARAAYSYGGTRPRVQQWVGTQDEYKFNGYLPAVVMQFQNLMGLDNGTSTSGAPSGWTRTVYKDGSGRVMMETNLGAALKHDLTGANLWAPIVTFLGLDAATCN